MKSFCEDIVEEKGLFTFYREQAEQEETFNKYKGAEGINQAKIKMKFKKGDDGERLKTIITDRGKKGHEEDERNTLELYRLAAPSRSKQTNEIFARKRTMIHPIYNIQLTLSPSFGARSRRQKHKKKEDKYSHSNMTEPNEKSLPILRTKSKVVSDHQGIREKSSFLSPSVLVYQGKGCKGIFSLSKDDSRAKYSIPVKVKKQLKMLTQNLEDKPCQSLRKYR